MDSTSSGFDNKIANFYKGRSVLITGATGFVGGVLLEKLLRSCPGLAGAYVLIRPGKETIEERWSKMVKEDVLFKVLREKNADCLKKVRPVQGDLGRIGLGLSEKNRDEIIQNVSIVFHVAAAKALNETLLNCILINLRGTKEVCKLATQLKNPEGLVYVSNAFGQKDDDLIPEDLNPPPGNWEQIIDIAESLEPEDLEALSLKLREDYYDNVCFTKALSEQLVNDVCQEKVPSVIFRPTLIVGAVQEPIKGYVRKVDGHLGLYTAVATGVARNFYSKDVKIDTVPVDDVVNGLIKSAWVQATNKKKDKSEVYNCALNGKHDVRFTTLKEVFLNELDERPLKAFWYPNIKFTRCIYAYWLQIYVTQLLPAAIFDLFVKFRGCPFRLTRQLRKVVLNSMSLHSYIENEKRFVCDKMDDVDDTLTSEEKEVFHVDVIGSVTADVIKDYMRFLDEHLMKRTPDQVERAKFYRNVMWLLYYPVKYSSYLWLGAMSYNWILVPWFDSYVEYLAKL